MTGTFSCPVDGTKLVPMERQGIEIDHCPSCRGVWLDRGELDKIIERTAPAAEAAPAPRPASVPPSAPYRDERQRYDEFRGDHRGYDGRYPKKKKSFFEELFD